MPTSPLRRREDEQSAGPALVHDRASSPGKLSRNSRLRWIIEILIACLIVLAVALGLAAHYAEPLIKARIIETLSVRFNSRVELGAFHVSLRDGVQVSGGALKIYGATDLNIHEPGIQPLVSVDEFRFRAGLLNLLRTPMRIRRVYLSGLQINVPPKQQRAQSRRLAPGKIKIYMDEFVCDQAQLVINTLDPDKLPLAFNIRTLNMKEIAPGQPLRFTTTLLNPKPIGDIQSTGLFGPWRADDPEATAVQGQYSFTHADLATIKGIGGTLSSIGRYEGTLGHIVVDGETKTPDFQIAISGHPVPLTTQFHAIVDAMTGNTYLEPVKAKILHSFLTAKGSVIRLKSLHGHRIILNVVVEPAHIQDLLQLGVKADRPLMTGDARLVTTLEISPGEQEITDRLRLRGNFEISQVHFTDEKLQSKVDGLSMRGLGRPKDAKRDVPDVPSLMSGDYRLDKGLLSFSTLNFDMPGVRVDLKGVYSLDGNKLDFSGKARTVAKLSHMVTGWKSILLKPVDPFFSKHGAGAEIPVKVTGTKSQPHFSVGFGREKELSTRRITAGGRLLNRERAFQRQQFALDVESPAVAAQRSIRGNHPMAGNNDGDGIPIIRQPHSPEPLRTAHRASDVGIGAGLAIGDGQQRIPAGKLKGSSAQLERNSKLATLAGKVLAQFATTCASEFDLCGRG